MWYVIVSHVRDEEVIVVVSGWVESFVRALMWSDCYEVEVRVQVIMVAKETADASKARVIYPRCLWEILVQAKNWGTCVLFQ
jgi:hypothetical protein